MNRLFSGIKSLQSILYISLLLLIISTISIMGIPTINMFRKRMAELDLLQTTEVLDHLEQSVDQVFARIFRLSDQLQELERLQTFLSQDASTDLNLKYFLTNRFEELVRMYDDVVALFAFGLRTTNNPYSRYISYRGEIEFSTENKLEEEAWYSAALAKEGEIAVTLPHLQNFIAHNYIWVLSFSRKLKNPVNGNTNGVLLIDVTLDDIKDICARNSTATHYYYLTDHNGAIIFHPHEQLINSDLFTEPVDRVLAGGHRPFRLNIDGKERIYRIREERLSRWKIIAVTDVKNFYAPFVPQTYFVVIWLSIGLLFLLFVVRFIADRVLNPIRQLRESIKEVENGHFDIAIRVSEYDEISALARDFNIMIRHIGDLMKINEEEQRKLRESDFKALQSQINPHFLYNTLDSVIWMAAKNKKEDVITMISSLSKLMRRTLATGESLVTLQDEYDHAHQYCTIQQIRYRDQLDYSLELPEDCRNILVPRLILQPLIENSLYHGIEDWDDGGDITITAIKHADCVKISVSDNGMGADINALQAILRRDVTDGNSNNVGLKNIHDRLRILFGEDAGISFQSHMHQGLEVILTVPLSTKANTLDKSIQT